MLLILLSLFMLMQIESLRQTIGTISPFRWEHIYRAIYKNLSRSLQCHLQIWVMYYRQVTITLSRSKPTLSSPTPSILVPLMISSLNPSLASWRNSSSLLNSMGSSRCRMNNSECTDTILMMIHTLLLTGNYQNPIPKTISNILSRTIQRTRTK